VSAKELESTREREQTGLRLTRVPEEGKDGAIQHSDGDYSLQ
jgi:hypothetical protein